MIQEARTLKAAVDHLVGVLEAQPGQPRPGRVTLAQPYPDGPLFTWFNGRGWLVDSLTGIFERLTADPAYAAAQRGEPVGTEDYLSAIRTALRVPDGALTTAAVLILYGRLHDFLVLASHDYQATDGWGQGLNRNG